MGALVTWIDTYTITAGTQKACGDSVLGKKIGFFTVSHIGSGENLAFDGLTIETIPEPATLGIHSAFGGGVTVDAPLHGDVACPKSGSLPPVISRRR